MEVLVEYDYAAQNPDELTIKKGDKIKNVVRKEDGWYEGEMASNGRRGVFPDNFVKVIKQVNSAAKPIGFNVKVGGDEKKKSATTTATAPAASNSNATGPKYVQSVPAMSPPPPPPPTSQQQKPNLAATIVPSAPVASNHKQSNSEGFLAKVLYTYVPVNDDELPIQENDTVQVLKLIEDGWFEGVYKGQQGVFPSNYVEKINEPSVPPANNVVVKTESSVNEENPDYLDDKKKNKKVIGIGFGNIFSGKQIELKTKENFNSPAKQPVPSPNVNAKLQPVVANNTALPQSEPMLPPQYTDLQPVAGPDRSGKLHANKIKARVLHNYVPAQPDELKLTAGEIIYIVDKNLEDEGWWKGEIISTGKVGLFPENFVEELPNDAISKRKPAVAPINQPQPPSVINTINPVVINTNGILAKSNNHNESLTNSPSSSSTNSLSRPVELKASGVMTNGKGGNGNQQQISSSLEENLSKSQSDVSEDLDDLHAQSDARAKLSHLKKTRQFNKRPPSFRSKSKDDEIIETRNSNSYEKHPHQNGVSHDEEISQFMNKNPDVSTPIQPQTQAPTPSSPTIRPISSVSSAGSGNKDHSSSTTLINNLVDEIQVLRQELDSIRKESSQTHADFKSVQSELGEVKKSHDEQMKKMQKRLQDLISEIDDEKKRRLALEVELERLKKTIND